MGNKCKKDEPEEMKILCPLSFIFRRTKKCSVYVFLYACMYKSQCEYVSTAWFYTCINFFSALFLIRDDSFLNEIPESEASYFLKKSTASEKLKLFEDKISKKIPVRKSINTSLCLTSLWHRPIYVNLHFWMKELFLLLISAFTGYLNCNHSTKF